MNKKLTKQKERKRCHHQLRYEVNKNEISISFPEEMKDKKITAQTLLYHAADESKDSVYNLETNSGKLTMVLPETDKGMYELKMDWKVDTTKYYSEHKVIIE